MARDYVKSFSFEFDETDEVGATSRTVVEFSDNNPALRWDQVLNKFLHFLNGCGYVISPEMMDQVMEAAEASMAPKESELPSGPEEDDDHDWTPVYE